MRSTCIISISQVRPVKHLALVTQTWNSSEGKACLGVVGLDWGWRPDGFPCIRPSKSLGFSFPIGTARGQSLQFSPSPEPEDRQDCCWELVVKNAGSGICRHGGVLVPASTAKRSCSVPAPLSLHFMVCKRE
jgi:hypothetical protein